MKSSRRIKRMSRSKKRVAGLSLVSLMDVFTILVFFLLTNSASNEVLSNPKEIALPDSVVESKPRETIVIFVSPEVILLQGEPIMKTSDALTSKDETISFLREKLLEQKKNVIGTSTKAAIEGKEVTLLADKKIPFKLLKRIMSTCTSAGYGKISLAVIQKASQG
ncbi:MAG: biopolymer transporter ExbD [Gammaproteobacteria bacterium]|nr:biopolymer transporter ExbD [Gammaproteobacteria bacterium]MCW8988205.1 biopolymer transporter ExbD [Gammaproteobacteria bacterium]MCW9032163.1 biopolymer transporter ExbD [Gammaproteobacteria bacterium]